LQARFDNRSLTNRAERAALLREIAAKLGEVPYAGDAPAAGATVCCVTRGTAREHGLFIEMRWLNFCDVARGFPALTQWLQEQGCRQFRYDFEGSGWAGALAGGDLEDD
jgi:hypothetical protein